MTKSYFYSKILIVIDPIRVKGGSLNQAKLYFGIFIICLIFTIGQSQWLETTIYLPDSSGPYNLGYNSVNNKIYCANFGFNANYDSTVTVIDGATNNIITTLNTGYRPNAFCYNPTNNKVYCINLLSGTLTIINGEFDTIITTLAMRSPSALCYNNINNRVFCANELSDDVTVIDGAINQVIATVPVGDSPRALAWDSLSNKVFCANYFSSSLTVIDGTSLAVIAIFALNSGPFALYSLANGKLYCVTDNGVIILLETFIEGVRPRDICYNPTNNKVYFAIYDSNNVIVLDGTTNHVIASIVVGDGPCALIWNSLNNKVYCANDNSGDVSVIDGVTNSVDTTIPVGAGPRAFAWNPIQNRTYVANYLSSSISVLRDVGGGINERTTLNAERLKLEIYPSPAKAVMRVRIPWSAKTIKIFDVSGKLIKEIASPAPLSKRQFRNNYATSSKKVLGRNDGIREAKISLKGIKPGIYFLRLGKEPKKFLVVK